MILSQLINRGTLRGELQRSAPQDYEELINLPSINGETVIGSKGGHDYHLANLSDIPGVMTGATAGSDGAVGLAPKPLAGEEGKVLFGDGTWKELITGIDYSTSEQNTGLKWVDGKDIFQKSFLLTNLSKQSYSSLYYYSDLISLSADYIQISNIMVYDENYKRWCLLPYTRMISTENIDSHFYYDKNSNELGFTIFFRTSQPYNISKIAFTAQYTKP